MLISEGSQVGRKTTRKSDYGLLKDLEFDFGCDRKACEIICGSYNEPVRIGISVAVQIGRGGRGQRFSSWSGALKLVIYSSGREQMTFLQNASG